MTADLGTALTFTALAAIVLLVFFVLLHPLWNYGEKHNTWWWNTFMRSDGPLLGTWNERVNFFMERHAATFGVADPRLVMQARNGKVELPAPLSSLHTYWEQDTVPEGIPPGWWRLWNMERKNLALVVEKLLYEDGHTADRIWWRIFPGDLWPEFTTHSKEACYRLVEYEDFARMGLQLVYGGQGMYHLEGWADSVLEAKEQVEALIDYIWTELPVIKPEAIRRLN